MSNTKTYTINTPSHTPKITFIQTDNNSEITSFASNLNVRPSNPYRPNFQSVYAKLAYETAYGTNGGFNAFFIDNLKYLNIVRLYSHIPNPGHATLIGTYRTIYEAFATAQLLFDDYFLDPKTDNNIFNAKIRCIR